MGQGERINAEDFADAMSLLATDQQEVVKAVAGKRDDKFDGLGWSWQGDSRSGRHACDLLGRADVLAARFDHLGLLALLQSLKLHDSEPLVYFKRSLAWRLATSDTP